MGEKKREKLTIFDTTLRDGEQSPGCSMNTEEKLRIAKKLEQMKVDVIEAGFPVASKGDFEAVYSVASAIKTCQIAGLCRANDLDIDTAWEALKPAGDRARIHTFIATSEIHLKHKLKMSESEVLKAIQSAVKRARSYTENVEFSCEDAVRTRLPFLAQAVSMAISAGAKVVNIPDTVGYTTPEEYFNIIKFLFDFVPDINRAMISVHCHNDLGLAVANSLAAVRAGARQVECTINGIGERAGNCSMEEFVMAVKTRADIFPFYTDVETEQITPASKLLSSVTGMYVQPNKAIVGANAFAHEAGIHQHGVLCDKSTYEIMTPESVGLNTNSLVLGKHSGKHALRDRLVTLGHNLSVEQLTEVYKRFKDLADKKKEIFDDDLDAIVFGEKKAEDYYKDLNFLGTCGTAATPNSMISISCGGLLRSAQSSGDGPVDAVIKAIKIATETDYLLKSFAMENVAVGSEGQAICVVRVEAHSREFLGHSAHTDISVAGGLAYVAALNKIKYWEQKLRENGNIIYPDDPVSNVTNITNTRRTVVY